MKPNRRVTQDEWLSARKALLEKEKAHMREGDRLAVERRELPWLKIEKRYTFETGTIVTDSRYVSEELPGMSVFLEDEDGELFLTYSTYARGLDVLLGTHHYLDLTPEGRNEGGYPEWPRRHDEYPSVKERTDRH